MSRIVTLCGVKQAKPGLTFIAYEPSEACLECRLYKVCVGKLEPSRLYRVVEAKNRVFPCPLHEGGVKLVVVEESPVEAAMEDRLIVEGATTVFKPVGCRVKCPNRSLCIPEGLKEGDRCFILKVGDRLECLGGLRLRRVLLKRFSPQPSPPASQQP